MKDSFINKINKNIKKEPKIKGITIKLSNKDYDLIKNFSKENNFKMSEIIFFKICEIIKEIEEYNSRKK
jgi:hypothetical protein